MKYGIWNVRAPKAEGVNALVQGGYGPLAAMILASRQINDAAGAKAYLGLDACLHDPYLMTDMHLAAARVAVALEKGEKIAVFGDYDVDGITATCLLTDYLRSLGGDVVPYIPARLEEGYGLNPIALNQLHGEGVSLIVTVDCGITAMEEAKLCQQLGMDLVITDHHECKETLPDAIAVVDPHRADDGYPHMNLSGVGVAFKLASALSGSQEEILERYADMVCLGTVADVMALQGENRVFVSRGLTMMKTAPRPGLQALMQQSNCDPAGLTAVSLGYMLAPRINAAGRMGQIQLAVELFLTNDQDKATQLAEALCDLNRQRQAVESEIYEQAISMLPEGELPEAIVLADENWHQGVVGIVASRIAEEFCCPTFLICLDGEHGKASSRSYNGFNLFGALTALSDCLESYGGHELAAGFTINRQNIPQFRQRICELAGKYYCEDIPRTQLDVDCAISPELLTLPNVTALEVLEPCGSGCPKPVLVMENVLVEKQSMVGNGKHMRLRLRCGRYGFNAIWFGADQKTASVEQNDLVDVAFEPKINDFRGERSVQMQVVDIRPACKAECSLEMQAYHALTQGTLDAHTARALLPQRRELAMVWRYLSGVGTNVIRENPICLCRKLVRWSGESFNLAKLMVCLDVFAEVELLHIRRHHKYTTICIMPSQGKADLQTSPTIQKLEAAIK